MVALDRVVAGHVALAEQMTRLVTDHPSQVHIPCMECPIDEFHKGIYCMAWNVEYTDEFGAWWTTLTDAQQETSAPWPSS